MSSINSIAEVSTPFLGIEPRQVMSTIVHPSTYTDLYISGGGFKYFCVHPYLGKIPILTNIFQLGWFNHQLDLHPPPQDDLQTCRPGRSWWTTFFLQSLLASRLPGSLGGSYVWCWWISGVMEVLAGFVVSFFLSFFLSFFRSFVLSFFRSFVLSFFRSFVLSFFLSFFSSFLLFFFSSFLLFFFSSFLLFFFSSFLLCLFVCLFVCLFCLFVYLL